MELATVETLNRLQHLLAGDLDHTARLANGDVCLWLPAPDGEPAGLLWINLTSHVDRYLGAWSRPDADVAYYNQLIVAPEHRGRGYGRRLVDEAVRIAHERGRRTIRAAVMPDNAASVQLHRRAGFAPVARVRGLRLGPRITLQRSRAAVPADTR